MQQLKNYQKPKGYKYYNYFITGRGDYEIYSRDGKRFYIHGVKNSTLLLLSNTPFESITKAKNYLNKRLRMKNLWKTSR